MARNTINNKKLSDFPRYDENPFLADSSLYDSDDYENNDIPVNVTFWHASEYIGEGRISLKQVSSDKGYYAKVYKEALPKMRLLSQGGLKILSFILGHLPYNKTEIFIIREEIKKICNWESDKPYSEGFANLVEIEFLARSTSPNKYYLNPRFIFRGRRSSISEKNPKRSD